MLGFCAVGFVVSVVWFVVEIWLRIVRRAAYAMGRLVEFIRERWSLFKWRRFMKKWHRDHKYQFPNARIIL